MWAGYISRYIITHLTDRVTSRGREEISMTEFQEYFCCYHNVCACVCLFVVLYMWIQKRVYVAFLLAHQYFPVCLCSLCLVGRHVETYLYLSHRFLLLQLKELQHAFSANIIHVNKELYTARHGNISILRITHPRQHIVNIDIQRSHLTDNKWAQDSH